MRLLRIIVIFYRLSQRILVEHELGVFLFLTSQTSFVCLDQLLRLHVLECTFEDMFRSLLRFPGLLLWLAKRVIAVLIVRCYASRASRRDLLGGRGICAPVQVRQRIIVRV